MSSQSFAQALKLYAPPAVFAPFTLVFLGLLASQIFGLFSTHAIVTRDPFGPVMLVTVAISILCSYLMTYSSIIEGMHRKKPLIITISLLCFLVTLWYSLAAFVALTQKNFLFSIEQPLLVAVLATGLQVLISHSRYLFQLIGMLVVFHVFFAFSLEQFYLSSSLSVYPLLQDIFNDIRYWNTAAFVALVLQLLVCATISSHFVRGLRDAEKSSKNQPAT
jgi:hypothetical protein